MILFFWAQAQEPDGCMMSNRGTIRDGTDSGTISEAI